MNTNELLDTVFGIFEGTASKFRINEEFNINDRELLEAIYNHTICNSDLKLSKILYIADKREESRKINDDVVEISLMDLDRGYKRCKEIDLEYLKSKGVINE